MPLLCLHPVPPHLCTSHLYINLCNGLGGPTEFFLYNFFFSYSLVIFLNNLECLHQEINVFILSDHLCTSHLYILYIYKRKPKLNYMSSTIPLLVIKLFFVIHDMQYLCTSYLNITVHYSLYNVHT